MCGAKRLLVVGLPKESHHQGAMFDADMGGGSVENSLLTPLTRVLVIVMSSISYFSPRSLTPREVSE